MEFLILTAARAGEVRGAILSEIDCDNRVWVIPAERMKQRHLEHRVPLTDPALAIIREAMRYTNGRPDDLLFPNVHTKKPLSDMAFVQVLRRLEIPCVAHGFRSSFKDWCLETNKDWAESETALSHQLGDSTAASYARADLLEQRRELMTAWADYIG